MITQLKEYIKRVYMLERSLYEQNCIKEKLNGELRIYQKGMSVLNNSYLNEDGTIDEVRTMMNMVERSETPYKEYKREYNVRGFSWYFEGETFFLLPIGSAIAIYVIVFFWILIGNAHNIFLGFFEALAGAVKPALIAIPVVAVIYLLVTFIRYRKGIANTKKENRQIQQENWEIERYNSKKLSERNIVMRNMQQEVAELNRSIGQTRQLLNDFYGMGVIYPKYQHDIVAIASFYEYLDSGRCNTLEGHEGAYNIYEMEIRMNHIICQLDQVIKHLKDIKASQYRLYEAISESNRNSNKILYELTKSNKRLEELSRQNEVMIYNQRVIAKNTEFLKWFEIYKTSLYN